jgi:uncharacterized protein (DUF4415 family)
MSRKPTGLIRFRLDPDHPPTLSAADQKEWEKPETMPDDDIDFSDISDQAGTTGWRRVTDLVPSENKEQITLRLDADVLAFFRSTGRRYQSRINAALRKYMQTHRTSR